MQEWIASVKVPSEEATALSRMADAAAAAAAFTAEGLRDDDSRLMQQAKRAELAKRAQQASDAVLRGESDVAALQEADRRSYSRSAYMLKSTLLMLTVSWHVFGNAEGENKSQAITLGIYLVLW